MVINCLSICGRVTTNYHQLSAVKECLVTWQRTASGFLFIMIIMVIGSDQLAWTSRSTTILVADTPPHPAFCSTTCPFHPFSQRCLSIVPHHLIVIAHCSSKPLLSYYPLINHHWNNRFYNGPFSTLNDRRVWALSFSDGPASRNCTCLEPWLRLEWKRLREKPGSYCKPLLIKRCNGKSSIYSWVSNHLHLISMAQWPYKVPQLEVL